MPMGYGYDLANASINTAVNPFQRNVPTGYAAGARVAGYDPGGSPWVNQQFQQNPALKAQFQAVPADAMVTDSQYQSLGFKPLGDGAYRDPSTSYIYTTGQTANAGLSEPGVRQANGYTAQGQATNMQIYGAPASAYVVRPPRIGAPNSAPLTQEETAAREALGNAAQLARYPNLMADDFYHGLIDKSLYQDHYGSLMSAGWSGSDWRTAQDQAMAQQRALIPRGTANAFDSYGNFASSWNPDTWSFQWHAPGTLPSDGYTGAPQIRDSRTLYGGGPIPTPGNSKVSDMPSPPPVAGGNLGGAAPLAGGKPNNVYGSPSALAGMYSGLGANQTYGYGGANASQTYGY